MSFPGRGAKLSRFDSSRQTRRWCAPWATLLVLACLAPFAAAPQAVAPTKPAYQVLDSDLGALRQRFNQDAKQPRVLMLLSPT